MAVHLFFSNHEVGEFHTHLIIILSLSLDPTQSLVRIEFIEIVPKSVLSTNLVIQNGKVKYSIYMCL